MEKKQTRLEGYGMSSVVGSVILGPSFVGFIHSILPFKISILSSFLCSIEIEWADSGLGKSANGLSVRRATTQNPQQGGKRKEENFKGKRKEENFQGNFQHENFQVMGLVKGMEVRREGGRIVFIGCDDVVIDLLAVEPWIPRLCISIHRDQYQQYAASADFVVSCLAIKLANEATDNVGLGPLVILANYGNTDTNANTLKGNSEQALTKAVQQEWRLKFLINLHKILLAVIYNENERQIITAVANIFEIGDITHSVLVGLCASLWGLGYSGTLLLNASVREIIAKTGKQVFVAEAEVIMGLQGNFSERIHQTLQMILQGPDSVQPLLQNNETYSFGYILGVCIGLKALCNKEDNWLKGIVAYMASEEEEENFERNGNRVSMVPKIFSHSSSWRKLLNL